MSYHEYRDMFIAAQNEKSPYVMFTVDIKDSSKMHSFERFEAQEYLTLMFNELPIISNHLFCTEVTRCSHVSLFQGDAIGFWSERQHEELLLKYLKMKLQDAPFNARVAKGYFETLNWLEGSRLYYGGYCFNELTNAHKEGGVGNQYIVLTKF